MCRLKTRSTVSGPPAQPPHLDPRADFARQQPMLAEVGATRLVKIFSNDTCIRNRRGAVFDQDRRGTGRVEGQELDPTVPRALFDQVGRQSGFRDREAREARERTERVMKQREHCECRWRSRA
jgi:hypothetical protein